MIRTYSTDVFLACRCSVCKGAEVRITARKMKYLAQVEQPNQDRLIHQLVSTSREA